MWSRRGIAGTLSALPIVGQGCRDAAPRFVSPAGYAPCPTVAAGLIQIIPAADFQALHLVLQSGPLQAQPRRRAVWTGESAVSLSQNLGDVIALRVTQRSRRRLARHFRAQLAERWVEPVAFRQNHRTLDEILQLADVSRPIPLAHRFNRRPRNTLNLLPQARRAFLHEMFNQHRDVLAALAQRRQM